MVSEALADDVTILQRMGPEECTYIYVIGASLSKPHTSMLAVGVCIIYIYLVHSDNSCFLCDDHLVTHVC